MVCHFLPQGIFLTQGSNPRLLLVLRYRRVLYGCTTWGDLAVLHRSACSFTLLVLFNYPTNPERIDAIFTNPHFIKSEDEVYDRSRAA